MVANVEARSYNLYVHPDETVPPFNTTADLLNAVLPFSERITIREMGPVALAPSPKYDPKPYATHFFPDGIVSLTGYDQKGYQKVVDGKEQSYIMYLRAVVSGVMVDISYHTAVRFEKKTPTQ